MSPAITDINGITVGTAEDREALTGCTVVLVEAGATCGADVRGSAPGTRETDLLDPVNTVDKVNAIVLTGGSSYGLESAQGVMQYLEEKGVGLFTGKTVVPIIPAAVLFDLNVGDHRVRPDKTMGYRAASSAGRVVPEGNYGAGTGATVGKAKGHDKCTKGGQGTFSITLPNGLIVGALVAVNAFGEVLDPAAGRILAGVQNDSGTGFIPTSQIIMNSMTMSDFASTTNTTLAVVATNAKLTKSQAKKVAQMAHNGLVRVIQPVHTSWDGDTVFALSTGELEADVNLIGMLAIEALAQSVLRAVKSAETILNLKCSRDILGET